MSNYKLHDGTLYDYTAGVYCGVLVKERVMKKLAQLQAKHIEEVKRLLSDSAANGEVFPSSWTLHYPNGKQTNVYFIDEETDVHERIKAATRADKPKARYPVFIASGMEEAEQMANDRQLETEANPCHQ